MKYNINFCFSLVFIILITSCSDNKNENSNKAYMTTIDSLKEALEKAKAETKNTILSPQESESKKDKIIEEEVITKSKFKNLADVFSSVITEGSTIKEVEQVQGKPTLILPQTDKTVIYFYGNSEVIFRGEFVREVKDFDNVIKYAGNCDQLSIGSDPLLKRFARYIQDRRMNSELPSEHRSN